MTVKTEIRGVRLDYELSDPWDKLAAKREEFIRAAEGILNKAEYEKRDGLTPAEEEDFNELERRIEVIDRELRTRQANGTKEPLGPIFQQITLNGKGSRQMVQVKEGQVPLLTVEQRMADLVEERTDQKELSLGRFIKGIVTGDWRNADAERRAMSESVLASGGYMVPTPLAARLIDLARNQTRVFQAGAMTVPMDAETLKVARVESDPTVSWKMENDPIPASDMTFGQVEFKAKTLVGMAKMSVELFEDAQNIDQVVENALSQAVAIELDRAALRGSGTDPEPRGIRNTNGIQIIDLGENGAQITDYSKFSEAVQKIQEANGPDASSLAVIYAPRTAGTIDRFVDSTGQPLQPPESFRQMRKFVTNQVPVNLTKGTSTNASEAYVGDFRQLWIGLRRNVVIEVSRQAADSSGSAFTNLQVWIRIYARYDVQLARPNHFVVIDGIIP